MNITQPHATTYEQGIDPIVDQIVNNLRQVYDPEIHLNIYDLGLIYDIDINNSISHLGKVIIAFAFVCSAI